jgi:hypothetical protein
MRRTFMTLSVLAVISFLAGPAHAGSEWSLEEFKASENKHDWEGLGVGTMLHFKQTSTTKVKAMPNMAARETVMHTKKTLVKITDTHLHFKEETTMMAGMPPQVRESKELRKPKVTRTFEKTGTAKIKVGNTELDCIKYKVTTVEDGKSTVGDALEHPEHGMVQMTSSEMGQTVTITCSKLSTTVKAGGTEYSGREFTMKSAQMQGGKMAMVWSHAVPGRLVKMTTEMDNEQVKMSSVRELVEFVKK